MEEPVGGNEGDLLSSIHVCGYVMQYCSGGNGGGNDSSDRDSRFFCT